MARGPAPRNAEGADVAPALRGSNGREAGVPGVGLPPTFAVEGKTMTTRRTLTPTAAQLLRLLRGQTGAIRGLPEAANGYTVETIAGTLASVDPAALRRAHYMRAWAAVHELRRAGLVDVTTRHSGGMGRPRLLVRAA